MKSCRSRCPPAAAPFRAAARRPSFADETLRDGLQSPSIHNPSPDQELRILHYGFTPDDDGVASLFAGAKSSNHVLTESEIRAAIGA